MVVLIVEWSYFRGGLKAGFYCTLSYITFFVFFQTMMQSLQRKGT